MKQLMFSLLICSSVTLGQIQVASAATQTLQPVGGSVEILAVGKPSFLKIKGQGPAATGEVKIDSGKAKAKFQFELKELTTGIQLRDEHMREKYLEVGKHAQAILEVEGLDVGGGWSLKTPALKSNFTGKLTLHGVTQPMTGEFEMKPDGRVEAKFKLKLSDFKIEIPSYAGITVANEVDVKVVVEKLVVEKLDVGKLKEKS